MVKNLLDNHPDLFVYPPNELHFFKFTITTTLVARQNTPATGQSR